MPDDGGIPNPGGKGEAYGALGLRTTSPGQPAATADLDSELGGSNTLDPVEHNGDNFEHSGDRRKWRLFLAACLCGWSLICIGIATGNDVLTVFFVVLAAVPMLLAVRPIKKMNDRKQRILAEQPKQHALTGKAPKPDIPTLKALMIFIALAVFGCLGFLLACVYFHDGNFLDPDGDISPQAFAVQLWFGLFALVGGLFTIMACLVWLVQWRKNLSGLGPSPDFDPTKGPELPRIRYPAYHMVIDCLVPLYIPFAIGLLACIAGFYSPWYAVATLFVCFIAFIPAWRINTRLSGECERLQLYFDWHDNFARGKAIDENIVALKEERDEVTRKYEGASAWIHIMLAFLLVPLLWLWPTTAIKDIGWGWLYFGIVLFLGNLLVLLWAQELWELVQSRIPKIGSITLPESFL